MIRIGAARVDGENRRLYIDEQPAQDADRVLFLDKGRILEQGPPAEILKNPKKERTRDFLRRVIHAM